MLFVQTNVPVDQLPANINIELTQQISDLLVKPKNYIFVSVSHVPNLTFQGEFIEFRPIGRPIGRGYLAESTNLPPLRQRYHRADRAGRAKVDRILG